MANAGSTDIREIDVQSLEVIKYPDPRLEQVSAPLEQVGESLQPLVGKMFELMFQERGVGLAAPQVGINIRMFVASPSFEPEDLRVYVNPEIVSAEGTQDVEEGCLSLPGVCAKIKRFAKVTIRATGMDGQTFEETGDDLLARIYQHEIDHLDGKLLMDRMNSISKLSNRRAIRDLQEEWEG